MKDKVKLNNYYKELPENFVEDYVIDAKKKSVGILLNVVALVLIIAVAAVCGFAKFYGVEYSILDDFVMEIICLVVLFVSIFVYLVVHELTHGAVYKIMTKQKLNYGFTLTVAYCGLKEGYVNKKTALIAMLAPFVIHSIWMIVLICLLPANVWCILAIVLFALHFGGCAGDLYGTLVLIFKYRHTAVLMNDSGPKQTFYVQQQNIENNNI